MKTCKFCGCYLPDRFTACVACHKDNAEKKPERLPSTGEIYYYEYDEENRCLNIKTYEYIIPTYGKAMKDLDSSIEELEAYERYINDHTPKPYIRYEIY